MRRSSRTLIGRVHEQTLLEIGQDVDALYALLDPTLRAECESTKEGKRDLARSNIRAFVRSVRSAEVDEVEILEATKVCKRYGSRPAARVRKVVLYNDEPNKVETTTIWVRDEGVWYATTLSEGQVFLTGESG